MKGNSSQFKASSGSNPLFNKEAQVWDELRAMFVGQEKVDVDRLQRFLDDPEEFSKELARRLPHAINLTREHSDELTASLVEAFRPVLEAAVIKSSLNDPKNLSEGLYPTLPESINQLRSQDEKLAESLVESIRPIVEQSIRKSAELSIKPLSEGLYPVIGPAIRKAVADAFKKMNQALNQNLERTFSFSAFKWRWEAFKTGRSFIEVVAQHTLLYQVKQVFIIHRETGLLLQSVTSPNSTSQDADMVSAMLKAIQDFVKDSFDVKEEEELSTIEVGNQTIWIEQGPNAILAAIVDGSAPNTLRSLFSQTLERLHVEFARELDGFEGETGVFEQNTQLIEFCLRSQLKKEKKRPPVLKVILILLLVLSGVYYGFQRLNQRVHWSAYIDTLKQTKGIIITDYGRSNGQYFIVGLRQPGSVHPDEMISVHGLDSSEINTRWTLYQPLSRDFILSKSIKLLKPPKSVTIDYKEGSLILSGTARRKWIQTAKNTIDKVWEINDLDTSNLIIDENDRTEILLKRIEANRFTFASGRTDIANSDAINLELLSVQIKELLNLLDGENLTGIIHVNGYADSVGNPETNIRLSVSRAEKVRDSLVDRGIGLTHFSIYGHGSGELQSESQNQQKDVGRKVTLYIDTKYRSDNHSD